MTVQASGLGGGVLNDGTYIQLKMDLNKERLKNRLNVKFEPLKLHPSAKKIGLMGKLDTESRQGTREAKHRHDKESRDGGREQSGRNKSITQLRLPSLEKRSTVRRVQQKTEQIINMREMRQRIKSIKVLPTIKVESREPINDTITYLLKNQILTVPKIVAMLQKSQSQEFLYMKVTGIYEFQVCAEQEKGKDYITVSRNGMVREGELTPLDSLIHEYQIFRKLSKNHFFKYYPAIKFMARWHHGSRMIRFVENRFKVKRALFLDDQRVLSWKVELKELLYIADRGGHVNSGWVGRVARQIEANKQAVQGRLLQISVKLLQKFQLPISQSFQLMKKVLGNLLTLNINFQKKIRIEKELEIVYKLGMMLEFYQLQTIAFFLIDHIDHLTRKFDEKNRHYVETILQPMSALEPNNATYAQEKQKLLLGSSFKEEVSFKMSINSDDEVVVEPSVRSILGKIKQDIKQFVSKVQGFDYRIIRLSKFDYVVKNVVKLHEVEQNVMSNKEVSLKEYIYSINAYYQRLSELEASAARIQQTINERIALAAPFHRTYMAYRRRAAERAYAAYSFQRINQQVQQVEADTIGCQSKLHDGQPFILGYLSQLDIKDHIVSFLRDYKERVLAIIPAKIRQNKQQLVRSLQTHLAVLRIVVKSADDFIRVHAECEHLEDKLALYGADLLEIEKLQDLYLRVKKIESMSLVEEKGLLNEMRMKVKNYRETRETSYLLYKKELENYRKDLVLKVDAVIPSEELYELSPSPVDVWQRCHQSRIRLQTLAEQLKHLNGLQSFFDIKTTLIPKLQTLLMKFQSLEEIWHVFKEHQLDREHYFPLPALQLEVLPLIKKYQLCMRKAERYNKDPDYYKLAQDLLERLPLLLSTLYFAEDLRNPILRPTDFDEITTLMTKGSGGSIPMAVSARAVTVGQVFQGKLYLLRELVLQINFKSHKQQEIERMLREYEAWFRSIKLEGEYLEEYPLIIIFGENDQLRREIEEYTIVLLNIINHKYGGFARRDCNNHLRNINKLASLLELAIVHQEKFLALFPILTSKYAEKQLPSEAKKFLSIIQKTMKNVKWLIRPTDNLNDTTRTLLQGHIKHFDSLAKTLAHFLEKKRLKFQRFYFLQDDELLEVLVGIGADNTIFRMFEGIRGWLVDKDGVRSGVQGVGGEALTLRGWSYKQQEPEVVFKALQDAIRSNLNSIVRGVLHNYENQLKQLKNLYPGVPWMCVYTVELILFTKQMEINCFQNNVDIAMQGSLIHENIASSVSNPVDNANYITLQLFLLHFTEELRREEVRSVFDFKWHSFLRYYYEKDSVVMRVLGAQHPWGGEYQGLWNLMVNTSDIRRAHTSILSNIKHGDGVLLQGPSGTGKTESLKELGRCMAKYCVIFNCSSEVNIRTLQKLLSGLCYTGSWLCLDQINRLTAEIMSVVASQIHSVKSAVVQGKEVFSFMGKDMRLRKGVGIFSTMNPMYLKRAKLTESLKSYFRVISVNVPDYEKILEVMLYGLGIAASSAYAHKISALFKDLSIQLSLRSQYDFGLRAMKFFTFNLAIVRKTVRSEEQSVIQALCKTFYSRLQAEDRQSFLRILQDMFGRQVQPKEVNYKVSMMREAPQTGIIVLGPTSSKTTLINQYIGLFPSASRNVEVFNPNSLELKYFLGESIMGRWEQGAVERMARGSFDNPAINYLLILDCKLKSQTIENFNTLLDDSRLLSLSNGTRLKIHSNFKLIMQTPDLQMTSPATITRCNVIYVSEQDIAKPTLIRKLLPSFNSLEATRKMQEVLSEFTYTEIHRIVKVAKLIFLRKVSSQQKLTEAQSIGFEKCIFFSLQLLGLSERVKQLLHKDNSIISRKSIFNYSVSFTRYREGEFLQLEPPPKELRTLGQVYIPTIRDKFYEYFNMRAFLNSQNILWRGEHMTGKTTALTNSLQEVFRANPESKNFLRVGVNPNSGSKSVAGPLQQRMSGKEQEKDPKTMLVFVDDIHLSSEQVGEFFRFATEYQKLFSYKAKEVLPLLRHVFIADCSNSHGKEYTARFARHFAELTLPPPQQSSIRSIFAETIRNTVSDTRVSADFKASYELQVERLAGFMVEYLKINNKAYQEGVEAGVEMKQELESLGYCALLPALRNIRAINDSFCKETPDFICFLLSELRTQEVQHRRSPRQIDFLKMAYSETFKHKYQSEYERTLESPTGHPTESIKYSSVLTTATQALSWEKFIAHVVQKLEGNYYVSEFMLLEVLRVLRVLERQGGNYYLVGAPALGRKTILKIAAQLANRESIETLPQEKKIAQWYFGLLRAGVERGKDYAILIPVDSPATSKILSFLQRLANKTPVQDLFTTEDCEYAYSQITVVSGGMQYDKQAKSYDEVITDFVTLTRRRIQLLLYSTPQAVPSFTKERHYLHQETLFRLIEEVPAESILQVSNQILQKNLEQGTDRKGLTNLFLKVYGDLSSLVRQNVGSHKLHFKYNPFYHYKVINSFITHFRRLTDDAKEREDILNRSILKVHEISHILEKLKVDIKEMEPKVKEKTDRLRDVVPVLEAKKKASQDVRTVVLTEKREIQERKAEIEEMVREVEQKIARAEPILQETNDSVLTLKRGELSELRNNPNPHPLIRFTLENMVILLGQPDSWDNIKKLLSDPGLLTRLKSISPQLSAVQKAKRRIDQNREWTFDNVSKVSFGVRHMVRWINSIIKFHQLKASLDGERARVQEYRRELASSQAQLSGKQGQLDVQEDQTRVIQHEYSGIRDELVTLQELASINTHKLENAELIKGHLHEEINNWYDRLAQYKALRKNSEATSILVTLHLEVFGALHLEEQTKIQQQLHEHFHKFGFSFDPNFDILDYIKDSLLRSRRNDLDRSRSNGRDDARAGLLTLESLAVQDAANPKILLALYHMRARPILLDPDNQAVNWIQRQLAGQGQGGTRAVVTKESFVGSVKTVQAAMRDGHVLVLIIEDQLDQFTTDILQAKSSQGGRIVEYNKNILHVSPHFRLLLCNKSRNPNLSSKLCISHPVLNFEITASLLRGILLREILQVENGEMHAVRLALQLQRKTNARIIFQIEQQIIDSLISSKKTLVDDNEFISLLTEGQNKRRILKENEAEWRAKSTSIKRLSDTYADLITAMGQFFISLKLMARISPLLSWNCNLFVQYFTQAVQQSISTPLFAEEDDDQGPQEGKFLKRSNFDFDPYSMSFNQSRPTSAISFISGLSKNSHEERKEDFQEEHPTSPHAFENLIGHRQMQVDVAQKGTMSHQRERAVKACFIQFVKFAFSEEERVIWGLVLCLMDRPFKDVKMLIDVKAKRTKLREYIEAGDLTDKIKNLFSQNERFEDELGRAFTHANPFSKLPELSELEVLLLCKLLHPSKFSALSKALIKARNYGDILTYSQALPLHWFQRSDNVHPLLLVMGEDPISRISEYLTLKRYKNVILIPMGEGQGKLAEMVVQRESKRENLVIIHNLQIGQGFLHFLARMLQQFQVRPPHKNFRLVLISTVFEGLNEELTSYCHKYLIEQPAGMRNQLNYLREASTTISLPHPLHRKLAFVISYLHALVSNLVKYTPYGWNLKYEFHTADFIHALQVLKEVVQGPLALERYECNIDLEEEVKKISLDEVDFKALRYMLGEIGYVGKLADDIDRAKMNILVNHLLSNTIFAKDQGESQALGLKCARFGKLDLANIAETIQGINQNDAGIFGLHPAIKPISQYSHTIVGKLSAIYSQHSDGQSDRQKNFLKPIEPIAHKMEYINKEIAKFNSDLERIKMEGPSQALLRSMGNGLLLSTITPVSKIFPLKAFSNPREFFIAIKKEAAHKGNVVYERVELVWSVIPRENLAGVYGISGIKLEGGNISAHGALDDGVEQGELTLYVQAAIRKKEKQTRRLVGIPLYLAEERQGQINSYGDNTNLLVKVRLQASHPQEFWTLRSTAFVVM